MEEKLDSLGRRSRMRATSTGKRIRLTGRDWRWLQALHCHGPLASSYLLEFAKSFGASEKRAKERLGDLFHEDNTAHGGAYLVRPPQQFQTIDSRYNQLVYDLAPAGIRALKSTRYWSDRSGPNGGPWWHKFMVSSITSSIELGSLERDDLSFISQLEILDRAGMPLSCPVKYLDPVSKQQAKRELKPDALFGLKHNTAQGGRYRFFVLEADRASEPLTTSHSWRKSFRRCVAQYEAAISGREMQAQLKLTAPILVLIVTTTEQRVSSMLSMLDAIGSSIRTAVLFQNWDHVSGHTPITNGSLNLIEASWMRSGHASMRLV